MARENALGLPLLTKEMIEHASRRRTYILRTAYAILLFGFALLIFWGNTYSRTSHPFEMLGKGREMFFTLMVLQIIGITLFTPALTCGSITNEKEQNTFCLLILTRLGPWTILLEKYLSRLFMMLTYLLISLPLFGFCYSLGGIAQDDVWAGFAALFVTVLQLSAIGLFCSTYFRSTVGSFIATYLIGLVLFFLPLIVGEMFDVKAVREIGGAVWYSIHAAVSIMTKTANNVIGYIAVLIGFERGPLYPSYQRFQIDNDLKGGVIFCAPILVLDAIENTWSKEPLWEMLARCIPALCSACFFFCLSRLFIIRRAFVPPRNVLVSLFKSIDGIFQRLNQNRFTKGIVLIGDKDNLPNDEPITWRETTKTSLGTFRYLLRIFLVLEFPVLFICFFSMISQGTRMYSNRQPAISVILLVCWVIAVLLISVRGATMVSKERSHETLDVLLSTPLSSAEFVNQKFKGLRRLMLVVAVPILTAILTQTWIGSISGGSFINGMLIHLLNRPENNMLVYVFFQTTCLVIYLPMIAWLSFLVGLWTKTQTRAIFTALAIVVAWCVLPPVILISFFEATHIRPGSAVAILLISSPATVPLMCEVEELEDLCESIALLWILNTLLYASALYCLRKYCLKNAASMLGRSEL